MRNIDIVRQICSFLGCLQELITYVPDRAGHDLRYAVDASKLKKQLGRGPESIFAEELEKTVKWYVENKAWWRSIRSGSYRYRNAEFLKGV